MDSNNLKVVKEYTSRIDSFKFWKSIELLINKPFAVNRNIGGCDFFNLGTYSHDKILDIENYVANFVNINITSFSELKKLITSSLSSLICLDKTNSINLSHLNSKQDSLLLLRLTYPKNGVFRMDIFDLVYCDFHNYLVTFKKINSLKMKPNLLVEIPYSIQYDNGTIKLLVRDSEETEDNICFLINNLFFKLTSWAEVHLEKEQKQTLSLVEIDDYVVLYNMLKKKYSSSIKKIWTECTNLEKFIHEDIAIATYLILLWERKVQNFIDLGCGNGLLVFILNSEGHQGTGIDLRPRKIWSNYPPSTILKVKTFLPSENSLFPDADWIIGNHSDELTPWIPVIASRSAFKTNFFLLPCCAYEFNGKKYSRKDASKSQYLDYMDFIEGICSRCGFIVHKDRLRIPSTKRTCFISRGRTHTEADKKKIDEIVTNLINNKSPITPTESTLWLSDYKPREVKEKVRNGTQLDKNLINSIITHVSKIILKDSNETWNEGEPTLLSDIVKSIPTILLTPLKNESGGLQTILKNHRQIFRLKNGKVFFRKPVIRKVTKDRWKQKECWFFKNHPDSCPLSNELCSYIHEKS